MQNEKSGGSADCQPVLSPSKQAHIIGISGVANIRNGRGALQGVSSKIVSIHLVRTAKVRVYRNKRPTDGCIHGEWPIGLLRWRERENPELGSGIRIQHGPSRQVHLARVINERVP